MTDTHTEPVPPHRGQQYVLDLAEVRREDLPWVGGKGANLGELARVDGAGVPGGFCVTTAVFEQVARATDGFDDLCEQLSHLAPEETEQLSILAGTVRTNIGRTPLPAELAETVIRRLRAFPAGTTFAVRSSATAEDLPWASFAGQQDSYLNVTAGAVLERVRSCWISLFTDRAVAYRQRRGIDHHAVAMAVVVQEMLAPRASGVLFTADPVSGNRTVTCIEAVPGLGEVLVSGRVDPDSYRLSGGRVTERVVRTKTRASYAVDSGGTTEQPIEADRQDQPVLTDTEAAHLASLGRRVEAHFGAPQDIEWCLVDGAFRLVQSRPITTLFPVPQTGAPGNRVYLSVGHQQMMTDPIKPLGISFWQLTTPAPMAVAGGRLFVDVTDRLASPTSRAGLLATMGRSDPLMRDALETVLAREDFLPEVTGEDPDARPSLQDAPPPDPDPDPTLVPTIMERSEALLAELEQRLAALTGTELLEAIRADFRELRRQLFDAQSLSLIMAGQDAAWWLNEHLGDWLGEHSPADALTQSVSHNVTAQMGLALLDVADAIRPHPQVVAYLRTTEDDDFLAHLPALSGGEQARAAIAGYLDRYGMRCVGEIDVTRPRWVERPTALLPAILGNVDNAEPGAAQRRFDQGLHTAQAKERDLLEAVRALPDGLEKAAQTKRRIDVLRAFTGFREYPKYGMVCRYLVYKRALMTEAARLAREGVLTTAEDAFYLSLDELATAVGTRQVDRDLVRRRARQHEDLWALTPPRVLTSDGEAVLGEYRRAGLPAGALVGLGVSAGTVEGRARVVRDLADADLDAGDILVTAYTDPSWSPLLVTIAGLVTEVGGLMTHGAVIAREYGLAAVVGVPGATEQIDDGQRIRVDGAAGYVEILC